MAPYEIPIGTVVGLLGSALFLYLLLRDLPRGLIGAMLVLVTFALLILIIRKRAPPSAATCNNCNRHWTPNDGT